VRRTLGFEHNRDEPGYDPPTRSRCASTRRSVDQVEAQFLTNTTAELGEDRLTDGGVPVAPVLFVQELVDHPQVVQANNYVVELEHELAGPHPMQAPPWKMSVTPARPAGRLAAARARQRGDPRRLGYSAEQIEAMRSAGRDPLHPFERLLLA
jgi:crotonobetainyl-CoA:carnitine CoA-transferase CaiB-like acyl-CoA transferase